MLNRRKCSRCLWSIIMELYLHKGLVVLLLVNHCQAQEAAPPSPNPAPPNLVDVIDAVKAAFEQAVKISKDDTVRGVFEQVVEELVPQNDIAEQPPAIKDATDDALDATEHKHAENDPAGLTALQEQDQPMQDSSEQLLVQPNEKPDHEKMDLGQPAENPEDRVYQPNTSIEESVQELKESVQGLPQEAEGKNETVELIQGPAKFAEESIQGPENLEPFKQGPTTDLQEKFEDQSPVYQDDNKPGESPVQVELPLDSETEGEAQEKEAKEQAEGDDEKQGQDIEFLPEHLESDKVGETEREDTIVSEKVQKSKPEGNLDEQIEQMVESQPDQNPDVIKDVTHEDAMLVQDNQEEVDQWGTGVLGGKMVSVESEEEQVEEEPGEAGGIDEEEVLVEKMVHAVKAPMVHKTSHEPVEVVLDTERAVVVEDVKGAADPQELVIESNSMHDVTQETNDLDSIVTSRDPLLRFFEANQEPPTPVIRALPPFPTVGVEPGDTDELVEEPADKTQPTSPGQEVWKIGAIAAAFFLILQTIVTVIYILKCKRKPNSRTGTVKACEEGNRGAVNNTVNTETATPAEEQIALDDLPEYSEVQQENITITSIPSNSPEANSSNNP